MDEKIRKLQVATDEAQIALNVCEDALVRTEQELAIAKDKYRHLPMDQQQSLQMQGTELPELIDAAIQARNDYDVASVRLATNKKYLDLLLLASTRRADEEEGTTTPTSAASPNSPPPPS
jgi:hypothetical protein